MKITWLKAKKILKGLAFVVIFITLFVSSMAGLTYYHENAHKQIYARYGIASKIVYGTLWMEGQTLILDKEDVALCTSECYRFQMWNEIIGYHVAAAMQSAWFVLLAIFIWISFRKHLKKK